MSFVLKQGKFRSRGEENPKVKPKAEKNGPGEWGRQRKGLTLYCTLWIRELGLVSRKGWSVAVLEKAHALDWGWKGAGEKPHPIPPPGLSCAKGPAYA